MSFNKTVWDENTPITPAQLNRIEDGVAGAEPAFSKNSAHNKNFGTGVGTVCQGNDTRLSNARTPVSHDNNQHSTNYEPTLATNRKRQIFVQSTTPSGQTTGDLWIW